MNNKVYTIEELALVVKKILPAFDAESAILFGSYAKGCATKNSDIDIVINTRQPIKSRKIFEFAEKLESSTSKPVDAYGYFEIIPGGSLSQEIANHGVVLC